MSQCLCQKFVLYYYELNGKIDVLKLQRGTNGWFRLCKGKGKSLPQQAEVVQGVPDRLRSRIFLTFGTTSVVGR